MSFSISLQRLLSVAVFASPDTGRKQPVAMSVVPGFPKRREADPHLPLAKDPHIVHQALPL